MSYAHRRVFNAAVGIERRFSESLSILGGFNTDFNYMPRAEIEDVFPYYRSMSYLNLYNLNGGFNWFRETFNLILVISLEYGYKFGQAQQINLLDPKDYLGLFGPIHHNTENLNIRLNLVFGFTYKFPRITFK